MPPPRPEKRNYPRLFCKRIAKAAALSANIPKKRKLEEEQDQKVGAAKQPRKKFRDLIPEFKVTEQIEPLNISSEDGKIGFSGPDIGLNWSKEECVEQAKKLVHPFDEAVRVPQRIAEVIFNSAVKGKAQIEVERRKSLSWYKARLEALKDDEVKLHNRMNHKVRKVVTGKNIKEHSFVQRNG